MDRFAAYPLLRRTGGGLALTACAAVTLAGCGSPPKPLPTAPPRASGSLSAPPSAPLPSLAVPPTFTLPPTGLPTYGLPTYGLPTTVVPTRTTTAAPSPAPVCTAGPTKAQVLAAIRGKPGMPADQELKVVEGPYCAGSWQYFTVALAADADSDPLLVITRGRAPALTLVEAGADVCSDRVRSDAPTGIRVLACGTN